MDLSVAIDTMWVLLGAILVFFMQAGFTMVETGFTRSKNAGNIIMKNVLDFSFGSILYLVIGFYIMFGSYESLGLAIPKEAFLIFQTVFCATATTIVSGAVAERTKFSAYIVISILITGFIYPVVGNWVWGSGFLSGLGFHDFAGSTVVHSVGGYAALVGAILVGPRIGKYTKDGKSNVIEGHSMTLGALGVFILWFGWFGFNGCSTLGLSDVETAARIFMTTNLAAASSSVIVLILTWIKNKKPDVGMTLNGILGGLVAITAGCDVVSVYGALAIGVIAGIALVFASELIDSKLKIDDPVGAISVHGVCGVLGTICVGLFAMEGGLLYGGGANLLLVQLIGVGAVAVWTLAICFVGFKIIDVTIGLRVSEEEEIKGLDLTEHGLTSSYPDFEVRHEDVIGYAKI
ncbi:MAG: ammonium transporter [Peptostreptococcaceae bacterium]